MSHWAWRCMWPGFGSLHQLMQACADLAKRFSLESHPQDHAEILGFWGLFYGRMTSCSAHSSSMSKELIALFDDKPSASAGRSALITPLAENLRTLLLGLKNSLAVHQGSHRMLAPAINAIFTVYGTEVVRAAGARGAANTTRQLVTVIYRTAETAYEGVESLKSTFSRLMTHESYGNAEFPTTSQSLGANISASRQMTPEVPSTNGLVEFHAQIDLSLDENYLSHARQGNNFDLASNGIGLVAAGLSLYATTQKWHDTRRNVSSIGAVASHPATQLTAAFAEAYASVYGVHQALLGRSSAAATQTVAPRVFGNNPALASVAASSSTQTGARAMAGKALGVGAKVAGMVGVAMNLALAWEGYHREDKYMAAGNGMMALGGAVLLFATGPVALIAAAIVLGGFVISLYAYNDHENWVKAGFWGNSDEYWTDDRDKLLEEQVAKSRVLADLSHEDYSEVKKHYSEELGYYLDINSNIIFGNYIALEGKFEVYCATLQTNADLGRVNVTLISDGPNWFDKKKEYSDATKQFIRPGVVSVTIRPRRYPTRKVSVKVEVSLRPNGKRDGKTEYSLPNGYY